ncbi:hypothetical protein LguiA_029145 [Lonicera macranthoides]
MCVARYKGPKVPFSTPARFLLAMLTPMQNKVQQPRGSVSDPAPLVAYHNNPLLSQPFPIMTSMPIYTRMVPSSGGVFVICKYFCTCHRAINSCALFYLRLLF